MTTIKTVAQFEKRVAEKAREFYEAHPKAKRFSAPAWEDSAAQERMMRIGAEARALSATEPDDLYRIAVGTLHMDHIKYTPRNDDSGALRA